MLVDSDSIEVDDLLDFDRVDGLLGFHGGLKLLADASVSQERNETDGE